MDYLQYRRLDILKDDDMSYSFKPYYKWITFNTPTERTAGGGGAEEF